MEKWVDEADVDGFNIVSPPPALDYPLYHDSNQRVQAYAVKPGTFKDVIDLLIPELRRRGLFHEDYAVPKGTYRENVYSKKGQSGPPADHPASKYRWDAGVEEHKIPE